MKFYTPAEIEKEKDLYTDYVNSHHGDALENASVYVNREFLGEDVVSFYLGIEDANGHDTGSGLDETYCRKEIDEIDDFGPSACCTEGRLKYHGGSRYYCNFCGKEEIRYAAGFEHWPQDKNN